MMKIVIAAVGDNAGKDYRWLEMTGLSWQVDADKDRIGPAAGAETRFCAGIALTQPAGPLTSGRRAG